MIRLLADENILGLDALPRNEVQLTKMPGREITASHLADTDVLWVRSVTRVDAELLQGTPVRFVGTATAGLEHIDQAYLAERGASFAAAPGANANAVVEYVLAALLELETPWEALNGGGVLGVVGYGAVGSRLVTVADSMGWQTKVCDPYIDGSSCGRELLPLDGLLGCDVISLHTSLENDGAWPSYHLFDARELGELNRGQVLINASRGAVVDNQALLERLQSPDAPDVVLDVWEPEPEFDPRLLHCESLRIATPHIAGYSWHAKWNATCMLWEQMAGQGLVPSPVLQAPVDGGGNAGESAEITTAKELMDRSYRIREDDQRLRGLGGLMSADRGQAFDRLRKEYPSRFELSETALPAGTVLLGDARRLWQALGQPDQS